MEGFIFGKMAVLNTSNYSGGCDADGSEGSGCDATALIELFCWLNVVIKILMTTFII